MLVLESVAVEAGDKYETDALEMGALLLCETEAKTDALETGMETETNTLETSAETENDALETGASSLLVSCILIL